MRRIIFQLALAMCLLSLPAVAQQRAAAQQNFPARPMPPDMMASPDSHPTAAPKPERNALPQSDQATPAPPNQQRNATNAPALAPATKAPATSARKGRKAKPSPVPTPEPVAQAPAPPPPPPTPQQMPPSPPQVEYRNGLLTVSAKNSALSDVLNVIRAQTGANMTLPPGMNDRLFVQIGPAPPRDVISKLLSGTNFDYVLASSPQNPDSLQQVIVTPRQPAGPAVANANPGGYPSQSRLPGMGSPQNNEEEEEQPAPQPQQPQPAMQGGFTAPGGPGPFQPNPAMAPPNVANPTPFPQTPGPTGVAPVQPQGIQPPQMPPNQPPQMPPQGNQMKTPEQLLQELKQMQQQQQQQQQQKPPQ